MWYNGLDVHQTGDYVKLSCEIYIDCVLQTHGWEMPSALESDQHDLRRITPDASNVLLQLAPGPSEDTHWNIELLSRKSGSAINRYLVS